MSLDPTEEIFLAANLGGTAAVVELRKLALRYAIEFRRNHSSSAAFLAGRTYYEMPVRCSWRVWRARTWLHRSLAGKPEDALAYFLLGCIAFDEGEHRLALDELNKIRDRAFVNLNANWLWRDLKVLELRSASAAILYDWTLLGAAAAQYAAALQEAPEEDVPAPHDLVAIITSLTSVEALTILLPVIKRHVELEWEEPLRSELAQLTRRAHERMTGTRSSEHD